MKKNKSFPKPAKKLFKVEISAIEEDNNINNKDAGFTEVGMRSETVIASTADEAMNRVKLVKNKYLEEYYSGVTLISKIDYL